MRHLKLMPDYFSHPLWDVDDPGNVDPAKLSISDALRVRLEAWSDAFDATLDIDDPASSPGFLSLEAERQFDEQGRRLWRELQEELGSEYVVSYYSVVTSKLLPPTEATAS